MEAGNPWQVAAHVTLAISLMLTLMLGLWQELARMTSGAPSALGGWWKWNPLASDVRGTGNSVDIPL